MFCACAEFGLCKVPGKYVVACRYWLWIVQKFCVGCGGEVQDICIRCNLGLFFFFFSFFSEKNPLALPDWVPRLFSLWYLVFLSRIFVCFSCIDVVKLKCSHFIGYLRSHMCWILLAFEVYFKAVLNSSARNARRVHSCWPDTPELWTVGLHHVLNTSNRFAYT